MLTSAPLPSETQNIASQHSGLLAERAKGKEREREREVSLISHSADLGWAMVSSIKHDTHPISGTLQSCLPLQSDAHTCTHIDMQTQTQKDFKQGSDSKPYWWVFGQSVNPWLYKYQSCPFPECWGVWIDRCVYLCVTSLNLSAPDEPGLSAWNSQESSGSLLH